MIERRDKPEVSRWWNERRREFWQVNRHQILVTLPFAVISVLTVLLALYAWMPRDKPAPFTYSAKSYAPDVDALCPGETLAYTSTLTVIDVPTVVQIVRTVWRVDPPQTVVRDMSPEYANWFDLTTNQMAARYVIPELTPGAYEFRVSAEDAEGGAIEWYRVPFRVRGDCDE